MSWFLNVIRRDDSVSNSKYEIEGFSNYGIGPFEFDLDRGQIIEELEKTLPDIAASSVRFRTVSFNFQQTPNDSLISIGKQIHSRLPIEVKSIIRNATSIRLFTNDLKIPWELMHDGEEFIGLKKPLSISPQVRRRGSDEDRDTHTEKKLRSMVRVLFIVDTTDDLPQARYEVDKIRDMISTNLRVHPEVLASSQASYRNIRSKLTTDYFDIIHVSAHTKFDPDAPERSGIILNDGYLGVRDLYSSVSNEPPWLVFMNSCESSVPVELDHYERYGELSGLAFMFTQAGVSSYVGTSAVINDYSASQISVSFYDHLLKGYTVGESLMKAKLEFISKNPKDLSWSVFNLYGDLNAKIAFGSERDLETEVMNYVNRKAGEFTLQELTRELGIGMTEARKIITRLLGQGRIKN